MVNKAESHSRVAGLLGKILILLSTGRRHERRAALGGKGSMDTAQINKYLESTEYIDWGSPNVLSKAMELAEATG